MSDDVIKFPGELASRGKTTAKMPEVVNAAVPEPTLLRVPQHFHSVSDVLSCAAKMNLPNCVVLSELADGSLVLLDSGQTMAQTNWLIDRLKALMLAPNQPARP